MTLREAKTGREYVIKELLIDDDELSSFLFSLGCYEGQPITVVSHLKASSTVAIKDARYNIDARLAKEIII